MYQNRRAFLCTEKKNMFEINILCKKRSCCFLIYVNKEFLCEKHVI